MFRLLTNKGFALIGAPEDVFNSSNGFMGELMQLDERGDASVLSIQIIDIAPGAITDITSNVVSDSNGNGRVKQNYCIALARKL
jgi:hypothetical protein